MANFQMKVLKLACEVGTTQEKFYSLWGNMSFLKGRLTLTVFLQQCESMFGSAKYCVTWL